MKYDRCNVQKGMKETNKVKRNKHIQKVQKGNRHKRAFGRISLTLVILPGHFHVIFGICFIVRILFNSLYRIFQLFGDGHKNKWVFFVFLFVFLCVQLRAVLCALSGLTIYRVSDALLLLPDAALSAPTTTIVVGT